MVKQLNDNAGKAIERAKRPEGVWKPLDHGVSAGEGTGAAEGGKGEEKGIYWVQNITNMQKITKIVLTGGPCAGKTTALAKVKEHFTSRGYAVYA